MTQREETPCVYKATTKKGETAHFGEYSAAKAWAGWGSVEAIPLKTLTFVPKSIKPCTTCEALARTVMLDQTSNDTKREWVGLTDEEISEVLGSDIHAEQSGELRFIRAIEAKLRERNS